MKPKVAALSVNRQKAYVLLEEMFLDQDFRETVQEAQVQLEEGNVAAVAEIAAEIASLEGPWKGVALEINRLLSSDE